MVKVREAWNKFKTVESLYELQLEIEKQLEMVRECVTKCTRVVDDLSSFFEKRRMLVPETREMFLALMKDFRSIVSYRTQLGQIRNLRPIHHTSSIKLCAIAIL